MWGVRMLQQPGGEPKEPHSHIFAATGEGSPREQTPDPPSDSAADEEETKSDAALALFSRYSKVATLSEKTDRITKVHCWPWSLDYCFYPELFALNYC